MKKKLDLIQKTDLLASIDSKIIAKHLHDGGFMILEYGRNQIVHIAGQACTHLEVILSGHIAIERIDESGHLMTIAEFFHGDILGGNLLFSKNPYYPMTVTAKQPTVILKIEKKCLFRLFSENQLFLKKYLEYVSDHATILSDRITHYVNRTIRECIINYLNVERKKHNSDIIKLTMTKKALAERIGVQRTSLSRELSKMRTEGLIKFDANTIELLQGFPHL